MADEYWDKLKSLGKTALKLLFFGGPLAAGQVLADVAVSSIVDKVVQDKIKEACEKIEVQLREMYKRTARNSAITFAINLAGVLILIFKPFGVAASKYVSFAFFAASFVFWLARTILFIQNYGKTTVEVSKSVIQEKSVYRGIESYVLKEFPSISMLYAGIDFGSIFLSSLEKVPRIRDFVKYLVKVFWKRVALFAGIVAAYTIVVFWVVKPVLIHHYAFS